MSKPATASVIRSAVLSGVKEGAHKGDLQDAVWAAVKAATGRSLLTLEEAAFAQRTLEKTGYDAPTGFRVR